MNPEQDEGALPTFLIIGAAKCGTTSLHFYLDQHPDVFMARPDRIEQKEMRFFWRDDWEDRLSWYRHHFDPRMPARGEATPSYTHYPYLGDVPRRIHHLVPDAKLIYVVRDPVDRIVAHWAQTREDGDVRSLDEALSDLERPDHPLVCASRYATQMEQYLEYFSPTQLLVLDMDDLGEDRAAVIEETFRFIGVDPRYRSPAYSRELNTRPDKRALGNVTTVLWNDLLRPVGGLLPERARKRAGPRLKRALSRPVESQQLAPATEDRLTRMLTPEVDRLRRITGKEFAAWSM